MYITDLGHENGDRSYRQQDGESTITENESRRHLSPLQCNKTPLPPPFQIRVFARLGL